MDTKTYRDTIYAILDTVSEQIAGGLYLHKHEAAAVRFYADVASRPDTLVAKHPQDFNLVQLGYITHENTIIPEYKTVLLGSTWIASQAKKEETY